MSFRLLLPDVVRVVESDGKDPLIPIRDEEAKFVEHAVAQRRRDFGAGRAAAHGALAALGVPPGPVGVGSHREPLWPPDTVGSITHCDGYVAAAVARRRDVRSIGIDAEPACALPAEVVDLVAVADELARLDRCGAVGGRLLFSAKESIYKAWFPLTGRWLGFEDCEVTFTPQDSRSGSFIGIVDPSVAAGTIGQFAGRYSVGQGHVLTAVSVPPF